MCCASCGTAAVDDVTLKNCACGLVKYCSVDCQKNHRPQHKKLCRKRLAELRDKDLFTQPDGIHYEECPICCLPQPIDLQKSVMMACCSQLLLVCNGCAFANQKREIAAGLERRCAFCREPVALSQEEIDKRTIKRVKKNDPAAMSQMGKKHKFEGDFRKAFEYFTKAAELDYVDAHASLGTLYLKGGGVEKDTTKAVYHFEQAAIGGHAHARGTLADYEKKNGRFERAKKHFIIAANLGDHVSL
jgi:tetratricopeptide (TPR) repeat protein